MPLFPGDNFQIPTTPKNSFDNTDSLLLIDNTGTLCKITKADLLAALSSGGGSSGASVSLTFVSDGDSNGLFYYLGTNKGQTQWSDPSGSTAGGALVVTANSSAGGTSPSVLADRQANRFYTDNYENSWVKFSILAGKLNCNYYSIKSRSNDSNYYPRNWRLQGSNDDSSWIDLNIQANNQTLISASQWLSLPVAPSVAYSFFRIMQTGFDSSGYYFLCLDEVELYGIYTP